MVTDFFSLYPAPGAKWANFLLLPGVCLINSSFLLMEGSNSYYFFSKEAHLYRGYRKTLNCIFFPQNFPLCFHAHFP